MLTKEYLAERIAHHGQKVQEHVLAHHRNTDLDHCMLAEGHLVDAANHASIFNALTAIAAGK